MVQNEPTAGLLIFLAVLSLPFLGFVLPFIVRWYEQNDEAIWHRLRGLGRWLAKERAKRQTTYQLEAKKE